jgi:tetratricopeptide (TPR) repeat protein
MDGVTPSNQPLFLFRSQRGFSVYLGLGTVFAIIAIILGFFVAYNRFLVDRAIGTLEQSLSQVAYAQTVEDMKVLKFFLDELVMSELSEKEFDSKRLGSLEFSKSIVSEAKDYRQIRDVKFILEDVLRDRAKKRSPWMRFLDRVILIVRGWFGLGGKFAAPSVSLRRGRPLTPEEEKLYEEAKSHDDHWEIAKAAELYELLIRKARGYKDIVEVHFDLAYAYAKMGRFDKAKAILERAKEEWAGTQDGEIAGTLAKNVGELEALAGEREQMLAKIGQARNPYELQQTYFRLGLIHYKLFELRDAEEAFRNAATLIPASPQAVKALFYLGITLKFHAKYSQAADVFQEIVDRFPKSDYVLYARYQLADSYQKAGDYEKAAEEFEKLATEFPQADLSALSQFRAGYTFFYDMGDPLRAAKAFEKLKADYTFSESLSTYTKFEMGPFVAHSIRDYGFTLLSKGLFKDAKTAFGEAVERNRKDPWSHSGLATALALLGEQNQALETAQQALGLGADEYTVAVRGFVQDQAGRYQDAAKDYQKALMIQSNYPAVLYNLARLYEIFGDCGEAARVCREALKILDKWPEAHNNLGHAYFCLGKYSEAAAEFKTAAELRPDYVLAHYNLAVTYEKEGRKDHAEQEYRRVIALDPSFKQAEVAIQSLRKKTGAA